MPSRFVCLVILVYWLVAAFYLLTREVLPELSMGYAPDLRALAAAGKDDREVLWTIQVVDEPRSAEMLRTVGEAVTSSAIAADGRYELKSRVTLDSAGLFKGTPFSSLDVGKLRIESRYDVDPRGNLISLELDIAPEESPKDLITVRGKPEGRFLVVTFRGKGLLEQTRRFEYEPKGMVGNMFGPLDRLPGLHVGQRWETRMVNPLSGQVDRVRAEVLRRTLIHWGDGPVSVFEMLQSLPPLVSARSWVRTDGVILRQELPLPFVRLVLERQRLPDPRPEAGGSAP